MRRSAIWVGLAAALGLAAFAALPGRMAARQAGNPAVSARELQPAIDKANHFIELMKMTERAADSWDRYASWVDMKTGPTGRERYFSYGMYGLYDAERFLGDARAAAGKPPSAPKLDAAIGRYIDSYQALAPVMNRANDYYEKGEYRGDDMKEGKALHATMIPLAQAFLKQREATLVDVRAFLRDVERIEVAAIETREGRGLRWQAAQMMAAANRMIDVFPRERPMPIDEKSLEEKMRALGPNSSGAQFDEIIIGARTAGATPVDMKRYDEALKEYQQAVEVFDAFAREKPDGLGSFGRQPRALLDGLRALREPLARDAGRPSAEASGHFTRAVVIYYAMMSESSSLSRSQLRSLP